MYEYFAREISAMGKRFSRSAIFLFATTVAAFSLLPATLAGSVCPGRSTEQLQQFPCSNWFWCPPAAGSPSSPISPRSPRAPHWAFYCCRRCCVVCWLPLVAACSSCSSCLSCRSCCPCAIESQAIIFCFCISVRCCWCCRRFSPIFCHFFGLVWFAFLFLFCSAPLALFCWCFW